MKNIPEGVELPQKIKYLTALNIFYGNIAFGAASTAFGPVLTTLENKYGVDSTTISTAFSIMTGSGMIGTLAGGGFIFDRVNRQAAVIVIILIQSLSMFLIPYCTSLSTFFLCVAFLGMSFGAYDNAQFVWMLEMMQKQCPPYVQTQHFFFAVGTLVGPLVVAAFLDDRDQELDNHNRLVVPFSILAGLIALNAIFQSVLFTFYRYFKPPPEVLSSEQLEQSNSDACTEVENKTCCGVTLWSPPKIKFVLLCCAFYGAYTSMEQTTFQFFPKFGQNSELNLTESYSAYVLSGMTGSYATGRGASIIFALRVSPQVILLGNIVLMIIANILLLTWAKTSLVGLWTAGILFGLGFSSAFGSFAAYIERYIIVTNFIGSLLLIFGGIVSAIYPFIVGNFIDINPLVLGYVVFFSTGVIIFAAGTLKFITMKNKP